MENLKEMRTIKRQNCYVVRISQLVFSDDLREDSASTRVRILVRVLSEDAKLVVDLNAKHLVKKGAGM
jgi:hypothetical protein